MKKEPEEDLEQKLTASETDLKSLVTNEVKPKWYKRIRKGILTKTSEKKETPEGLWSKCPECNFICTSSELKENQFVCPKCNYHRITSLPERIDGMQAMGVVRFH